MMRRLFLSLLLLLPFCVSATVSMKSKQITQYRTFSFSNPSLPLAWASSELAACQLVADQARAANGAAAGRFTVAGWSYCTILDGGSLYFARGLESQTSTSQACPDNSTQVGSGTTCSCNLGFAEDATGQACNASQKCQGKQGSSAGNYQAPYVSGSSLGATYTNLCDGGCTVSVTYDFAASGTKVGTGSYSGMSCTGDPNSLGTGDAPVPPPTGTGPSDPIKPGAPARTPCAKGEYSGEINGVFTCVKPAPGATTTVKPTTSTNTSTNAAGEQVKTDTSKQTTCTGGTCTTTTTTTITNIGTGASTTTTATDVKDQSSFCAENPTSPICKSGSFGGACTSGFTCDGDAIQCAMAQEQHRRNCQLFEPDSDPASAVNKALAGDDVGNVDAMKAAAAAAPISVGQFDFAGRGWSRSCPQDPKFMLSWGTAQEFTLPLSKLCGPLGLMADIAVAITAIGCALFVLRVPQG